MYPHERSLVKNLAGKPFALIGVNSDQDLEIPRNLVKEEVVTWRSFQNSGTEERISDSWGVRGWPTVYIIDAEGVIRYKNVRGKRIDSALEELFEEMGEVWPEFNHEDEEKKEEERKAKKKAEKKAKRKAAEEARKNRDSKDKSSDSKEKSDG